MDVIFFYAFLFLAAIGLQRRGLRRQAPLVIAWIGCLISMAAYPAFHAAVSVLSKQPTTHSAPVTIIGFLSILVTLSLASVVWDERRKSDLLKNPWMTVPVKDPV